MNFRLTIGLLVVLGGLGAAIALTGGSHEPEPQREADRQLEVFDLQPAQIERLEVRRGAESRSFLKNDGNWTVQPDGEPAHVGKVEATVFQLASLRAMRRIEAAHADLNAFGLGTPRLIVQLGLANGTTHLLHVGDSTPVQTGYYARSAERSEVYVLSGVVVSDLEQLVDEPDPDIPVPAGGFGSGMPRPLTTPPARTGD